MRISDYTVALGWLLAGAAGAAPYCSEWGVAGIALGSACGALVGTRIWRFSDAAFARRLQGRSPSLMGGRWLWISLGLLGYAGLGLLLAWMISWLVGMLPASQLAIAMGGGEAARRFFQAAILVGGIRFLACRWSLFRVAELAAIMVAAVAPWAAHRHGQITRPVWFVDFFVERGWPPADGFWWSAVLAFMAVPLVLSGPRLDDRAGGATDVRKGLCLGLLGLVIGLALVRLLPQMPLRPPPPPVPPVSFSADPPPPPPPNPEPLALVELQTVNYQPCDRLKAYYFRETILGDIKSWRFVVSTNGMPDELRSFPAQETALPLLGDVSALSTNATGAATAEVEGLRLQSVRTRVSVLGKMEKPIMLVSAVKYLPDVPSGKMYRRAYVIESAAPGFGEHGDLRVDTLDPILKQRFGEKGMGAEQRQACLTLPSDPRLKKLADGILAPLKARTLSGSENKGIGKLSEWLEDFPELAQSPTAAILMINEWINGKATLSSAAGEKLKDQGLDAFLFGDLRGGMRELAGAAALLYRAAAIPSRLVEGYLYDPGKDRNGTFLITDQHASQWPEVYLDGAGWVPVPLRPRNVEDRDDPPPQKDLETALAEEAQKPAAKAARGGRRPLMGAAFGACAAFVAMLGLVHIGVRILRFVRRFYWNPRRMKGDPARIVYRAALDLTGWAVKPRPTGCLLEDYAKGVASLEGSLAEPFKRLTEMNRAQTEGLPDKRDPTSRRKEWLACYVAYRRLCIRIYVRRLFSAPAKGGAPRT